MTAKLPLRIAAVVLFLFALGHTLGFPGFRPVERAALDVLDAMHTVPFNFGGRITHWYDLYQGFGYAISVSGFVFPIIAWRLSTSSPAEAGLARFIAWLLCLIQVASIVLSLAFFGPVQAGFSAACAAILAWGALRLRPA